MFYPFTARSVVATILLSMGLNLLLNLRKQFRFVYGNAVRKAFSVVKKTRGVVPFGGAFDVQQHAHC